MQDTDAGGFTGAHDIRWGAKYGSRLVTQSARRKAISNKGKHLFVIHELFLSEAAGHQQNIELRRLGDTLFGRQN